MDTLSQRNLNMMEEQFVDFKEMLTKIGIWVNGKFFWLNQLYTDSEFVLNQYPLSLQISVYKGAFHNCEICCVNIDIRNLAAIKKKVKVYFQQEFSQEVQNHVAYYGPNEQSMIHHFTNDIFICNGEFRNRGVVQYSTRSKKNVPMRHLWADVRKGNLMYRPISAKYVMSAFTLEGTISPAEQTTAHYWLIKSSNKDEAMRLNRILQKNTLEFQIKK